MISRESLELFAQLLAQVQLSGAAEDIEEQARRIAQARREILAATATMGDEAK